MNGVLLLILAISGIIIGASAITLSAFKDTTTDNKAINAIDNASKGIATIAEQQPTLAIINKVSSLLNADSGYGYTLASYKIQ